MDIKLQKIQSQLFKTSEQQVFFGGSCSIGKSYGARALLCTACLGVDGITTALIRKNYRDILLNHFSGADGSFQDILKDEIANKKVRISLNPPKIEFNNGSTIYSLSIDKESDLDKIQGSEFQMVFIDESCQLEEKYIRMIRARCRINTSQRNNLIAFNKRNGLKWVFPKMILASNPIGPSTLWHKETFVDKGKNKPFIDEETKLPSRFIYGTLLDNEYIDAKEYVRNLIGLGDETLMQAFLYGNFDIASDGFVFGKYFDKEVHIVKPFKIPNGSILYRSLDWGYSDSTAVLWYYVTPNNETYIVGELVINKTEPEDIGGIIGDIDNVFIKNGCRINQSSSPADTQIFAKTTSELSIMEQMKPIKFCKAYKGKGSRVAGIYLIKQMLKNAKNSDDFNSPKLFIFDTCECLIKDIESIQVDPKNPFDANTNSPHDHTIDSLRYFLYRKPSDNQIIKRVTG